MKTDTHSSSPDSNQRQQSGIALITSLMMLSFIGVLFMAYFNLTLTERDMAKSSKDTQSGFNAAEAGLNLRSEDIRAVFRGYDLPEGVSPGSLAACDGSSQGSGDYACRNYEFESDYYATTYVTADPTNPIQRAIPPGEIFTGLSAQEFRYSVRSVGRSHKNSSQSILDLTFFSRLIPLFQFAIFFQDDLEIFNGATMTVDGRVHTNGNFYLSPQTGGTTNLTGQVSVAETLYRGKKSISSCSGYTGTASVSDTPDKLHPNYITLPSCSSSRTAITDVAAWKDNIDITMDPVRVPDPSELDSFSDGDYWQKADLRLVLRLDTSGNPVTTNSPTAVEVVGADGLNIPASTNLLHDASCTGLITQGTSSYSVGERGVEDSSKLRLYREYNYNPSVNNFQRTLEVDMIALLNCLDRFPNIMSGKLLNDATEGGLVFYFAIDGPLSSASHNNYSVRIRNGATLQSTNGGASTVRGLTLVSDQGMVIWGDYNSGTWIPSALMADTLWLLSNNWTDALSLVPDANLYDSRTGNRTTVNAAVLSGIRRTGGANGAAGEDQGDDSNGGGAINVFRFNQWFREGSTIPDFTYVGSIVSLGPTRHSDSTWGPFTYYSAPNRVWSYETRFNDPSQLPPMTPNMTLLKQELFLRDYDTNP